jgi:hypothetical protein
MKKLATLMLAGMLLVPFTVGMAQDSGTTTTKKTTKTKKGKKSSKKAAKKDAKSDSKM